MDRPDLRRLALGVVVAVNLAFLLLLLWVAVTRGGWGFDWAIYADTPHRLDGGLYDREAGVYAYRYSPLLAYVFAVLAPIGYLGWTAVHFAALLALPRIVAGAVLLSWPFWDDVYNGNLMTFVLVAAWTALAGSRIGTLAFLVLAVLVPRPLMLPVLAYLLWTRPALMLPFGVIAFASIVGALATGWLPEWTAELLLRGTDHIGAVGVDWGPGLLIGAWWVPIGLALAAWFTMKGRLGIASLCASPYWLPHYLLMAFLELRRLHVDETDVRIPRRSFEARVVEHDPTGIQVGGRPET